MIDLILFISDWVKNPNNFKVNTKAPITAVLIIKLANIAMFGELI